MTTIHLHRHTIERSLLNRTVLQCQRAAGDMLRKMGVTRDGISSVEGIVHDVEEQVEQAAEISKIISAGNVAGMVNTMAVDGIILDEDELMRELDDMLLADDEIQDAAMVPGKDVVLFPSVPVVQQLQQSMHPQHATNPMPQKTVAGNKMSKKQQQRQQQQQQQRQAQAEMGTEIAMM